MAAIAVVLSILVLILFIPSLILPKVKNWLELSKLNSLESIKLATITQNVSFLKSFEHSQNDIYKDFSEKLIPSKIDQLRVASILNDITSFSGGSLDNMNITTVGSGTSKVIVPQSTSPNSSPQTGNTVTPGNTAGTTKPTSNSTTQNSATTQSQSTSYKIGLTYSGSFSSVLTFLDLLGDSTRLVGVKQVSLNKDKDTGVLAITINFILPISVAPSTNPTEKIELSEAELETVDDLILKLSIDASPTNLPTGRVDPFN